MLSATVVHVVDDEPSFLRMMARRLRLYGYTVATYETVDAFLSRPSPEARGCVLTDLEMPRRSGMDLLQMLARSRHPLPVVFISGKGDVRTAAKAILGGAEDFLTKTSSKDEIVGAIERALQRDARESEKRLQRDDARRLIGSLCFREKQVLGHLLAGLINKEIADRVGLAERTVKLYRSTLSTKLGTTDKIAMARLADLAGITAEELSETSPAHPA